MGKEQVGRASFSHAYSMGFHRTRPYLTLDDLVDFMLGRPAVFVSDGEKSWLNADTISKTRGFSRPPYHPITMESIP